MMKWILETERLKLREFDIVDAENMWKLNSDNNVIKYTGDPPFESIEDAKIFIKNYDQYLKHGLGRWTVILKSTQEYIGWCGLKKNEQNQIDIGFRFFKKDWGQGYATESSKACLDYAFNNLKITEIIGRAARENIASIHVLKKIGMSYWKDDACKDMEDSVYYRLSN